ncbi:hypothetical protein IM697_18645 [Streptomyces ferrugineus]|uniref:Uncharacterized protein n=1 Tax=Streptomyces ferrugineus TaxID=1413221 RepID=A0A7M2SY95_9ACTN|nr:hypothetical protein [Streptomyces ferrugineus]QOV40241.1 hypothetical protein IM697_18645 [Streptomyces ferrugineus]
MADVIDQPVDEEQARFLLGRRQRPTHLSDRDQDMIPVARDPAAQVNAGAMPSSDIDKFSQDGKRRILDGFGIGRVREERRQHLRDETAGPAHALDRGVFRAETELDRVLYVR